MKSIYKIIILTFLLHIFLMQTISAQNNKTNFKIEIKNSIGEPQREAFIKIYGTNETYKPDSCGIINFNYEVPKSYKRKAEIYLNSNKNKPVRTFTLDEMSNNLFFTIDTKENLLEFKKDNNTFNIEGIVTDENGEPIEGAIVSIQGTGRFTLTDNIGLFSIIADYNHHIIIRADGMENMSLNATPFLSNQDESYNIKMRYKNDNKVYSSMEKRPQYPGGMKYFKHYIDRNLKYPEKARRDSIEGVVVMQFIVEKNGDITSPKVVRSLEPTLDTVAVGLIKNMPRWTPGTDHGIIVRAKCYIPISFKITNPENIITNRDSIIGENIKTNIDNLVTDTAYLRNNIIMKDILLSDSISKDSIVISKQDSISNDSLVASKANESIKIKKRNAFVRFFRWLFGIKDKTKQEKDNTNKENKQL